MTLNQTHAVNHITENLKQQGNSSLQESVRAPAKEHFQAFLNSSSTSNTSTIDPGSIPIQEEADIAHSQTLGDDNVSAQKSGTSTDDQQKRRGQEQTEEVEAVSATQKKKTSASSSSIAKEREIGKSALGSVSVENVQSEIQKALSKMEQAKGKLSQPNTTLKPSYHNVVRNHLGHIDEHLKIALSKTGVEYTPPPSDTKEKSANPIYRFIDSFTHSEGQMKLLESSLSSFLNKKEEIKPGDLLAIQIKISYVQQQIELLTNLLNKALESTKTIMNVQV